MGVAKAVLGFVKFTKTTDGNSNRTAFAHSALYIENAQRSPMEVVSRFTSSVDGLSRAEAEKRMALFGPNELATEKYSWQKQLFKAMVNPFILLLSALGIVSYFTDDIKAALVMGSMVVISVTLTFFQEFRSNQAAARLKEMVSTRTTVSRIAGFVEQTGRKALSIPKRIDIPISAIVPGDLVLLSAGDMIPADLRLIAAKDLFISQASLTGEAMPVEKFADAETSPRPNLLEIHNLCFMGSNVISGTASGIVMKTGSESYVGSIARKVSSSRVQTSFDKGIHRFTWLMLKFMMVMVPLVFVVNGVTKGDWFESFLFAVAVAVGLTPEMLPMIVTVNLAKGALAMSKRRVIVKRLSSIQNFGAMDVLCTDKTGTLTQDNVVLEKYVNTLGEESPQVLRFAYLNSYYQTGLKNLLDRAILKHVEVAGELRVEGQYRKVDEIPFDFTRRRMSVVVARKNESHVLICKGALEEMFRVCSHYESNGKRLVLDETSQKECLEVAQSMNDDGLRVVAVGYREESPRTGAYSLKDESELILLGFVAFLDPPKETTFEALRILKAHGVTVKVLTGDNDRVTRKICNIVGLPTERIVLGSEIEEMSDEALADTAEQVSVFAKLTPAQKERIVRALHLRKHVVGFLGDGINDAPALKAADVGISVDNAVDVAKESADIILLEKSLLILEQGIIEGRKVFGNIIKYIKMGASSNFGNVFSVLGSSLLLPFLPMLPVQLLTQNLLYDISQTAIPFDDVDKEYVEIPRKWQIEDIGRFMIFLGPVSSIFDFATFGIMWWVFGAKTPESQALFQSGWFIEGLLSQTLIVHMIRTQKIPFIQSRAAAPLMLMTGLVMALGIYIPFSSFGAHIGLVPLPLAYFPWLLGMLVCYCFLTQAVKTWFVRRYGFH